MKCQMTLTGPVRQPRYCPAILDLSSSTNCKPN